MFDTEQKKLIATRIRELRKSKKLSHQALATDLTRKYGIKISKDSLLQYEVTDEYHTKWDKVKGMNIEYLYCLADYFNTSTDYLLGITNTKTVDLNIKAICEYTGLSENAVNTLHTFYDDAQNFNEFDSIVSEFFKKDMNAQGKLHSSIIVKILNSWLENDDTYFVNALFELSNYKIYLIDWINEAEQLLTNFNNHQPQTAEKLKEAYDIANELKLSKYKAIGVSLYDAESFIKEAIKFYSQSINEELEAENIHRLLTKTISNPVIDKILLQGDKHGQHN